MQFIDLKAQQDRIRTKIDARIRQVLDHGKYIMGPEVNELEEKLADYVGVKHCIGVSSGTDALLIAMMAFDIGPGDEVITTPFSFIATAEMIVFLGAKPVFVDIDPRTYNIDPSKIETAISSRTKAILPVSLYGQCADYDRINAIADKHAIPVIEDAAQSFGATYKGNKSCSLTTIGCTSFFPSKPLGAYGDGGACFTNDNNLAENMKMIRIHGQDRRYHHSKIGLNGRLDTLQAAILLAKMEIFPDEVKLRAEIGQRYSELFKSYESKYAASENDFSLVIPPYIEPHNQSVFSQYTIQLENRLEKQEMLAEADIPVAVHYPIPLNQQPALHVKTDDLAIADDLSNKVMSLPMHPYLSVEEQHKVVDSLLVIYRG